MESFLSETVSEKNEKPANKTRLSLFLPPDVTIYEPTKTQDKEYLKQLQIEEDTWKQVYEDQKKQKKKLLKELELNNEQYIDYSLFDEEELKYINAAPDITKFIQEVEDLENMIKYVSAQREEKRQEYNAMLENIEKACLSITSAIIK